MTYNDRKTANPSPEAFALTLEVIGGRMTMEAAINQLAQQKLPKLVRR